MKRVIYVFVVIAVPLVCALVPSLALAATAGPASCTSGLLWKKTGSSCSNNDCTINVQVKDCADGNILIDDPYPSVAADCGTCGEPQDGWICYYDDGVRCFLDAQECPDTPNFDVDEDGVQSCVDCDDADPEVGMPGAGGECGKPKTCPEGPGGGGSAGSNLTSQAGPTANNECCSGQGGPVRPLDGTMWYSREDIRLEGAPGRVLSLSRTYQTRAARADDGNVLMSWLGAGWRFSFESWVSTGSAISLGGQAAARVTFHWGNGTQSTFQGPTYGGIYSTLGALTYSTHVVAPQSANLRVRNFAGGIRVTQPDGSTWIYEGSMRDRLTRRVS